MPHQQQQQQQQHHANMISPSSLPSELIHGANCDDSPSSSSCPSSTSSSSSAWQEEEEQQQIFFDDLKDVLTFMKRQESSYEKRATNNRLLRMKHQNQFLSNNSNNLSKSLPPFYNSWRPVMISWMYHIADTFRLMPIVVATGIYLLDTCAVDLELENSSNSNSSNNSKQKYPLMTMTALNMAVKCHETKMFPLDQLVLLLGGNGGNNVNGNTTARYTPDDICTMERYMLEKCEWKLHKPTTHDYILRYVSVLPATSPEQRDTILSKSILYLKYSLLWEHILHNQESESSEDSNDSGNFSSCVLAYAAFLLAMEDTNTDLSLSFNEKQSACLCLLECGNLSASTPFLQQAYNWLLQSKSLQTQLEYKQQNPAAAKQQVQRSSFSQAVATATPPVASVEAVVTVPQQVQLHSPQVVLSSTQHQQHETTDTTSNMDVDKDTDKNTNTTDLLLLSFDNDEKRIAASKSTLSDDDTADTSIMTCSDSSSSTYHEIIYCSYSSSSGGDAFEVVASSNISDYDYDDNDYGYDEYEQEDDDNEDEDDNNDDDMVVDDKDHSMAFLPTVLEGEEQQEQDYNLEGDNFNNNVHVQSSRHNDDEQQEEDNNNNNSLVLTESLDEDGFEIAYGNNKNATSTSGNEQLRLHANSNANNFITSPRDVSIAL
ncbi:hypothetical protein FRACYDRAFT_249501 [Fragilariopsis cylindrus CCMP1102]|uniref:Cyclin N-terminal domain-containing protein n=1 Tax=Fragilariopsis cylindrus CCMP1102 TaxID=635003 RepID=A0A1E7ERG4_9STRA|nr:hypothetical protein FRACYDRAFT_249501 [Fragilariopsis cylindrus CCMP1102]|eukprot:OEU08610.1 hypothetical protein FRACYDRAFT_249501 [Fragilariopsis cylindrus CCMP1102]